MTHTLQPEKWVEMHADYLYGYAISMLHHQEEAQDLIQETFFSALKAKDSFKGLSSERTWLTSILRNKILDYFRKASTIHSKSSVSFDNFDFFKNSGMLEGFWKIDKGPLEWDRRDPAETENISLFLQLCLTKLPASLIGCINLRYLENISSEEICKILAISESNLWTRLHRAKLLLRSCIELQIKNNEYER